MYRGRQRSTGAVYGIDLGTTFSCIATVGADGAPPSCP
jgi:molecular chaperone DnaK (HSP70)